MAAIVKKTFTVKPPGVGGKTWEFGTIDFNGASTAEVPTSLTIVDAFTMQRIANVHETDELSLNEGSALSDGRVRVPSTGKLSLVRVGTSGLDYQYWVIGD